MNFKYKVIGGNHVDEFFIPTDLMEETNDENEANIYFFMGGTDVNPELYGQVNTNSDPSDKKRDLYEVYMFNKAQAQNKLCIGICRGLQFLSVMAGGTLIQDCNQHAGNDHSMQDIYGNTIKVNSYHHQMVNPNSLDLNNNTIIAYSKESSYYIDENGLIETEIKQEPEIIHFKSINSLGFQYHPEWHRESAEYNKNIITNFLTNNL